jgi:CubicO group peptidase (beta-lactamase class C family)
MSRPESHGFSSARLAHLDRFLKERYLDTGRLPCAQVQVLRGGERVHESVQGQSDRERGRAATRDDVYRIYSMTKPITSLAFMMLVEEGAVALDDPVS